MTRPEILDTAKACACGDREQDYGAPEDNFLTIAQLWEPYLKRKCVSLNADVCVNPEDVAALLSLVKIGRIASGNAKADNWVDLAGYAACGGEIEGGTSTTVSDKPVEPWTVEETTRKENLFCSNIYCYECPFYHSALADGSSGCIVWCKTHPAEARKIMDKWEGKHGVD